MLAYDSVRRITPAHMPHLARGPAGQGCLLVLVELCKIDLFRQWLQVDSSFTRFGGVVLAYGNARSSRGTSQCYALQNKPSAKPKHVDSTSGQPASNKPCSEAYGRTMAFTWDWPPNCVLSTPTNEDPSAREVLPSSFVIQRKLRTRILSFQGNKLLPLPCTNIVTIL